MHVALETQALNGILEVWLLVYMTQMPRCSLGCPAIWNLGVQAFIGLPIALSAAPGSGFALSLHIQMFRCVSFDNPYAQIFPCYACVSPSLPAGDSSSSKMASQPQPAFIISLKPDNELFKGNTQCCT